MNFDEFREAVSQEMERVYGITWADACGDDDLLITAHLDDPSPAAFVRWYGEKYDLTPKEGC